MKVFRCDYIPHTSEERPEALSYLFGYLTKDEADTYNKYYKQSVDLGVAYLQDLLSHDNLDDRLEDEDIYYYIHEGVEVGENVPPVWGVPQTHRSEPEVGDIYRGLVYDDDLTIVIKEVYSHGV